MTGPDPSRPPLIDERLALRTARLVAPTRASDEIEASTLRQAVAEDLPLVDDAARAWTGLGADLPPTYCHVVSRVGWVGANLAVLRDAFDPLGDRLRGSRVIASRVLGIQIGALLGLLSTKVLGQYVLPLGAPGAAQLVVVGPNLLALGDEHGALADDIRRAVLLHEVTHRLQFDGVPWLGEHLRELLATYLAAARLDPAVLLETASRLPDVIQEVRRTGSVTPVIEAVLTEEQQDVLDRAQGLMSLLEGHGNAVMFAAADGVVADPDGVRQAVQQRRSDVTTKILTAVAGLEMKRRQYRVGEAFVTAVVDQHGIDTLNLAFRAPENLPSHDEVDDPDAWVSRVTADHAA